ncbi:MAG: alpha/beta hydrolase [Vitreoscilla sp.]|nr:alpha/beta hydrolase [Vitreoscilla sp.]
MHERIARVPVVGRAAADGRTSGITGLVYRSIRGVTQVVGGSLDALLGALVPALGPVEEGADDVPPRREREAIVAALNGVMGDYLAESGNPLALTMTMRSGGRPLVLERAALAQRLPGATGRLLVLAHGLCMNDLQWQRDGHDHGAMLARERGFTPVYLHYNTGLHVSLNGRMLAAQLEQLADAWPVPLERTVLLCHSMGGLLARSAYHQACLAGMRWPARIDEMVFLGTPHHGAPLERAGHWIDILLGAAPYAAPFARLGKLRSAGITDLRHGNLLDEDWVGRDRFARGTDRRQPVPLPETVRCLAIAATTGEERGDLKDRLLGDGLVPLDSALGRHPDPARALAFAEDRQWVGHGINHMALLSHPEVAAQLLRWVA